MNSARWLLALALLCGPGAGAAERPALATVSSSEDHAVDGGTWNTLVKRTAEPWLCAGGASRCVEHTVIIDNRSPLALECMVAFSSQSGTGPAISGADMPAVVLPRMTHEVRGPIATTDTKVEVTRLDCRARPPYQRLKVDKACKYEMFGKPFEEYYPADAVRLGLEGPVVIAFTLADRSGHASDIAVAESSLVSSLDQAAERFVKEQRFTTGCPGTRFDVRMRFTLRDRFLDVNH